MRHTAKLVALQPSKQQFADYANALITVNNYAFAITNQRLPVLNEPPTNYANFTTEFSSCKAHAIDWSQNIFIEMLQLPKTITESASHMFSMKEMAIDNALDSLIKKSDDTDAKQDLTDALTTLKKMITLQVSTIEGIAKDVKDFGTNILADSKTLASISSQALQDSKDDESKISDLNKDIKDLQDKIADEQTILTDAEIGIGASIFVVALGAVVCAIPGGQGAGVGIIVTGVAGAASSIALTVTESQNIAANQDIITQDQKRISGLNQDVIILQGISNQFDKLYNANLKTQNALTSLSTMWTSLSKIIDDISDELASVETDATSAQYKQAKTDFQLAESNWKSIVDFCKGLCNISYKWQDNNGTWHDYADQAPAANDAQVTPIKKSVAVAA